MEILSQQRVTKQKTCLNLLETKLPNFAHHMIATSKRKENAKFDYKSIKQSTIKSINPKWPSQTYICL